MDSKKSLFDERFYHLIYTQQTRQHGVDYDFTLARAREDTDEQSPSPTLMLVAHLTREFAQGMSLSASQNRNEASARLKIDTAGLSKTEIDTRLNQDSIFIRNQALASMSVIFTEFVGFALYRAFGSNIHRQGHKILANHSFAVMAEHYTVEPIKAQVDSDDFAERDLLVVLWLAFVDLLEDLLSGEWGRNYQAAPVKLRYMISREARERFYREVENTNAFLKKRSLKRRWAYGVQEGQGLFEFVKFCLE